MILVLCLYDKKHSVYCLIVGHWKHVNVMKPAI